MLCGVAAAGLQAAYNPKLLPDTVYDGVWEVGPRVGAELGLGRNFGIRVWAEVLFTPYPTKFSFEVDTTKLSTKEIPFAAGFVGAAFVVKFRDYDD
jgi:hypothetical protein